MSKLFRNIFGSKDSRKKGDKRDSEERNKSIRFANQTIGGRHHLSYVEEEEDDLRDEHGRYKPTAPYHTNTRTRASRGRPRARTGRLATPPYVDSSDTEGGRPAGQLEALGFRRQRPPSGVAAEREFAEAPRPLGPTAKDESPPSARLQNKINRMYLLIDQQREKNRIVRQQKKELRKQLDELQERYEREVREHNQTKQMLMHFQRMGPVHMAPPFAAAAPYVNTGSLMGTAMYTHQPSQPPPAARFDEHLRVAAVHAQRGGYNETKDFRSENDGAPERLMSEQSLGLSSHDEIPQVESGRNADDEDGTLMPNSPPPFVAVEDEADGEQEGSEEGYATASTVLARPAHFRKHAVPRKIRRTSNVF
ncbi:hypothetical protein M3Y99_00199200 [Aphelenchoides fujianensis]|nr:hypothetical protein M3Y99_00199200 [Aphelenchoides fujianensis]